MLMDQISQLVLQCGNVGPLGWNKSYGQLGTAFLHDLVLLYKVTARQQPAEVVNEELSRYQFARGRDYHVGDTADYAL